LTHARLTAPKPALGTILATLPYMLPLTHSNRHSMSVWLTRHAASSSPELSSSRFVLKKPQSDPGSDSSPGQRAKKNWACIGHGQSGCSPIGCRGVCFRATYENKVSVNGWNSSSCENTNLNISNPLPTTLIFRSFVGC
jgi:hypothetical protein